MDASSRAHARRVATRTGLRRSHNAAALCSLRAPSVQASFKDRNVKVLVNQAGTLMLTARRTPSRLYLERRERLTSGAATTVSTVFRRLDDFVAWWSAEPIRFEEPLLAAQLRRFGDGAFFLSA